jgi:hypothetical protein
LETTETWYELTMVNGQKFIARRRVVGGGGWGPTSLWPTDRFEHFEDIAAVKFTSTHSAEIGRCPGGLALNMCNVLSVAALSADLPLVRQIRASMSGILVADGPARQQ